jgi:hypothetical protein
VTGAADLTKTEMGGGATMGRGGDAGGVVVVPVVPLNALSATDVVATRATTGEVGEVAVGASGPSESSFTSFRSPRCPTVLAGGDGNGGDDRPGAQRRTASCRSRRCPTCVAATGTTTGEVLDVGVASVASVGSVEFGDIYAVVPPAAMAMAGVVAATRRRPAWERRHDDGQGG